MKFLFPLLLACAPSAASASTADALKKINPPILGLLGGQDHGITPAEVNKFKATMDQLGKKGDVKIYDDAGHAFENPNNQEGYRAEDAADAWKRTVDFLALTLKK
jgi:carboxymethylenebutenolidase